MPTYRTSMTLIAAWMMAAGTSFAEGNNSAPKNGVGLEAKKNGYITVEESVGSLLPLRQSYRLDSVRGAYSTVAQLPPAAASAASAAVPAVGGTSTASAVSAVAILDKAAIADIANAQEATAAALLARLDSYSSDVAALAAGNFGSPVGTRAAMQGDDLAAKQVTAIPRVSEDGAFARVSFVPDSQAVAASVSPAQGLLTARQEREVVSLAEAPRALAPQFEPIKLAAADPAVVPMIVASAATTSPIQDSASASWRLAREDRTVRAAIERWARQADWNLSWEFPTDFLVEFSADFDGEFIDAVTKVVDGLSGPERPLRAEFYKGNRVLRILSGRQ